MASTARRVRCAKCRTKMTILNGVLVPRDTFMSAQGCFACQTCGRHTCYECSDDRIPCICGSKRWIERLYSTELPGVEIDPPWSQGSVRVQSPLAKWGCPISFLLLVLLAWLSGSLGETRVEERPLTSPATQEGAPAAEAVSKESPEVSENGSAAPEKSVAPEKDATPAESPPEPVSEELVPETGAATKSPAISPPTSSEGADSLGELFESESWRRLTVALSAAFFLGLHFTRIKAKPEAQTPERQSAGSVLIWICSLATFGIALTTVLTHGSVALFYSWVFAIVLGIIVTVLAAMVPGPPPDSGPARRNHLRE